MSAQDWIYLPDTNSWINMALVFVVTEYDDHLEFKMAGADYPISVVYETNKEDANIIRRYLVKADG